MEVGVATQPKGIDTLIEVNLLAYVRQSLIV